MNEIIPEWAYDFIDLSLDTAARFSAVNGIYADSNLVDDSSAFWSRSEFAVRSQVPYTTTWCEQQIGEELVNSVVLPTIATLDAPVFDLGCGDGRYVEFFLRRGYTRIVALNYEMEPLLRLQARLNDDQRKHVFLICADIMDAPLRSSSCSLAFAWGMLTCLPDFRAGFDRICELTKPLGHVFCVEPTLEHAAIYSLVRHDLDDFIRTITSGTRAAEWNRKDSRYEVFASRQLEDFFSNSSVTLLNRSGVSVLPALVFGGVVEQMRCAGSVVSEDLKAVLWEACRSFPGSWERQSAFLMQKISDELGQIGSE